MAQTKPTKTIQTLNESFSKTLLTNILPSFPSRTNYRGQVLTVSVSQPKLNNGTRKLGLVWNIQHLSTSGDTIDQHWFTSIEGQYSLFLKTLQQLLPLSLQQHLLLPQFHRLRRQPLLACHPELRLPHQHLQPSYNSLPRVQHD